MALADDVTTAPHANTAVRFPTRRLGHANIYVGDRDKAFAFYNGICGFDMVGDGKSSYFLSNGNSHHDFALNGSGSNEPRVGTDGVVKSVANYRGPGSLNHFGWETDNQVALVAAYKRAQTSDVRIMRSLHHGASRALYLFDPDGVYHEFYADVTREWRKIFHGGDATSVTSGWDPLEQPVDPIKYWDPNPKWVTVEKALIHPLRISRTVAYVSSLDKLLPFYRDVAGLDLLYQAPDRSYAYLRGAARQTGWDICLIEHDDEDQSLGYHHVSTQLADERSLEDAETKLKKAGIATVRRFDDARKRSFFLRDPDGVPIEFFVERTPDYTALSGVARAERPFAA
ncbi:MAG: hypothetical protein EXQ91_03345 [Alphaproteobacteria bacterium]|nr:hypothetical protein [Alphaproteobacteria bacterium]